MIEKELKSIIKQSGHCAIQGVLNVLPKANKELAKDNPVVLLNKGLLVNHPWLIQGTMQQTISCDRKWKDMHGSIVVRKPLTDKENWRVPENELDWQFPRTSYRGKDQCKF